MGIINLSLKYDQRPQKTQGSKSSPTAEDDRPYEGIFEEYYLPVCMLVFISKLIEKSCVKQGSKTAVDQKQQHLVGP